MRAELIKYPRTNSLNVNRRALTLVETLAAVVLLATICATLLPLLRIAQGGDYPVPSAGSTTLSNALELKGIAADLVANPASFGLNVALLETDARTTRTLDVPLETGATTSPSRITTIELRSVHSFESTAGRFMFIELSIADFSCLRILRIGDVLKEPAGTSTRGANADE